MAEKDLIEEAAKRAAREGISSRVVTEEEAKAMIREQDNKLEIGEVTLQDIWEKLEEIERTINDLGEIG